LTGPSISSAFRFGAGAGFVAETFSGELLVMGMLSDVDGSSLVLFWLRAICFGVTRSAGVGTGVG